ncbi:TPA: Rha family transcriptional regulator [Pseudomonas aeruginosa]|nr:Rha family transcriptional regulator [Pseudomonas aeruginosa]
MNALTNKPVTMSSREIAELTGKNHFDVMRDIRKMLEALGKDESKFAGIYLDAYKREKPCFNLPRREVEILLTGYSIPLRAKVIDRLHELEEQAKGTAFRVPQSLPEALRLAAELAEKNEQLALENKEMAPKAVVFDNCVALRQESLATFVRTLEGVNTMAIKGDLADMGYLYRTVGAGKYRVYAKYRDVLFTEKLIAHPTRPVYEILPTPEGKKLIVQLYRDGKLTMKKAYAAA